MYKLRLSRREKRKLLSIKWLIVLLAILGAALVVWLVWLRPLQNEARIGSFDECVAAGNPVQETYPEVCVAKDGKRFVNPKQDKAHRSSQSVEDELVPPSNPALLNLDIEEWGVRLPLTMQSFDLIYTYLENGGEEYLLFTYKRLAYKDICKGDIGLRLTRSILPNQAPFSPTRPAATAHIDKYYYYVTYVGPPCYDTENAEQVALVKEITGEKSLTQATSELLSGLTAIPKE